MLFLKSFLRAFIPVTKSIIFVDTTTFATNSAKKGFNDPNNSIPCSNCKSWNLKMRNWNRRTARSRVSCQSWRARPARQFQPHLGRSTESSLRWCVCVCVSLMSLWSEHKFCLWCSPTTSWVWVLVCVFCKSKVFEIFPSTQPVHVFKAYFILFLRLYLSLARSFMCPLLTFSLYS